MSRLMTFGAFVMTVAAHPGCDSVPSELLYQWAGQCCDYCLPALHFLMLLHGMRL
jgi:hypothetical protein